MTQTERDALILQFGRSDAALFTLLFASAGCWIFGWWLYDDGYRWCGITCWLVGILGGTSALGALAFGSLASVWQGLF